MCLLALYRTHCQLTQQYTTEHTVVHTITYKHYKHTQVAAKAQYKYGKLSFMKLPLDVLILNAGVMMGK
jgi:hypothetical protein